MVLYNILTSYIVVKHHFCLPQSDFHILRNMIVSHYRVKQVIEIRSICKLWIGGEELLDGFVGFGLIINAKNTISFIDAVQQPMRFCGYQSSDFAHILLIFLIRLFPEIVGKLGRLARVIPCEIEPRLTWVTPCEQFKAFLGIERHN